MRGGYDHVTGSAIIVREGIEIGAGGIVGGCKRMEGVWRVIIYVMLMVGEMRGVGGNHQRGEGGAGIAGVPASGTTMVKGSERTRSRKATGATHSATDKLVGNRRRNGERDGTHTNSRTWRGDWDLLLNIALSRLWKTGRYTALKVGYDLWSRMTIESWV